MVVNLLPAQAHAVGEHMGAERSGAAEGPGNHRSLQAVSGMLMVATYAKLATDSIVALPRSGHVEPIFAGDVVGHKFVGAEAGDFSRESGVVSHRPVERQAAGEIIEAVVLATVEIYLEFLGIVKGAEARLAVGGSEAVIVEVDIDKSGELHLRGGCPHKIALPVEEIRVILPFRIGGGEQGGIAAVSHAVELREATGAITECRARPHEAA